MKGIKKNQPVIYAVIVCLVTVFAISGCDWFSRGETEKHAIEQIIINLATNARDAMPDGGSFTIETDQVMISSDFINSHGFSCPGTYALLSVTDTGL